MKFVRIHSTKNVGVSAGIQSINMSNVNANVPDRLNVKAAWAGTHVIVKEGMHYYPECMKDWDSVKAMVDSKIFTVTETVEESLVPEDEIAFAKDIAKQINKEIARAEAIQKQTENDPRVTESKSSKVSF